MLDHIGRAATWKYVAAPILDFCTVVFAGGYLIALAIGETAGLGFHLHGTSALAFWALVVLYFFVGRRYAGGTLWDRILRIERAPPGNVGAERLASDHTVGVRAGFWRRGLAMLIDGIIVSVPLQLMVAVLFVATSGRVQLYGDVAYTICAKLETVPERLAPPPPAGSNFARECNVYFLGAQTARILQVGRAKEGADTTAVSQDYMLGRDGRPIDGMPVDWIAILALIVYLVVMETRAGATLGKRVMGMRVIDVAAPARPSVPLRKIALRYLVLLTPILAGLLAFLGLQGSLDELPALVLRLSRGGSFIIEAESGGFEWHPIFGAYLFELPGNALRDGARSLGESRWLLDLAALLLNGWPILLIVQIVTRRDPPYDEIAGTAVVHDHQRGGRAAPSDQ